MCGTLQRDPGDTDELGATYLHRDDSWSRRGRRRGREKRLKAEPREDDIFTGLEDKEPEDRSKGQHTQGRDRGRVVSQAERAESVSWRCGHVTVAGAAVRLRQGHPTEQPVNVKRVQGVGRADSRSYRRMISFFKEVPGEGWGLKHWQCNQVRMSGGEVR